MFTGIVAACGRITAISPLTDNGGSRLQIDAGTLDLSDVAIGDSIAIQGACMTVVTLGADAFSVDVSQESLARTVGLDRLAEVNLEKALRLSDRLGGHLVSGHVDGLGRVERFDALDESHVLDIRVPPALSRYMAYKGSVTVNGVSLTVNSVADDESGSVISLNLIPHTVAVTTLRHLRAGADVNIEIDLVARYLERMDQVARGTSAA
ncbi:MAG: riboflavin synthase [Burkholderiaceae bacterium]